MMSSGRRNASSCPKIEEPVPSESNSMLARSSCCLDLELRFRARIVDLGLDPARELDADLLVTRVEHHVLDRRGLRLDAIDELAVGQVVRGRAAKCVQRKAGDQDDAENGKQDARVLQAFGTPLFGKTPNWLVCFPAVS